MDPELSSWFVLFDLARIAAEHLVDSGRRYGAGRRRASACHMVRRGSKAARASAPPATTGCAVAAHNVSWRKTLLARLRRMGIPLPRVQLSQARLLLAPSVGADIDASSIAGLKQLGQSTMERSSLGRHAGMSEPETKSIARYVSGRSRTGRCRSTAIPSLLQRRHRPRTT